MFVEETKFAGNLDQTEGRNVLLCKNVQLSGISKPTALSGGETNNGMVS